MIPILYEKNETAFTSNGLGRLTDCISCIVTEERNGRYECSFEYPINGNHFDDIQIGRVIACTHDDYGDIQPFDIYAKSEPLNGIVTFYAHHISYRLNEITVKPFEAGTVALALQDIKSYSVTTNPFTFWTDRSASAQFVNDVPRKARNMLGGEENSILDVFGTGEYEFDKFTVRFYAHRGQDTNISIRYGKNLTSFTNEYDTQDVYTAVVPYWKGQNDQQQDVLVTLSEWYITSGHSVDSGRMICVPLDLSSEFDDAPTQAQLRAKAVSRISSSDAWNPNQTVKINFVQLWQTEEYKEYAPLQRVRLCDTVGIFVPMYNMSLRAKVISVVYNVLLDRYNSMTLGDKPTTYAHVVEKQYDSKVAGIQEGFSAINASINSLTQDVNTKTAIFYGSPSGTYSNVKTGDYLVDPSTGSTYKWDGTAWVVQTDYQTAIQTATATIQDDIDDAIENATDLIRGGTGGYIITTANANGQPIELLITDNLDINQAQDVWRWNQGGLAHSSTGYNGPFNDVAILQDGSINASLITTGQLTANLIKAGILTGTSGGSYFDLDNDELVLRKSGYYAYMNPTRGPIGDTGNTVTKLGQIDYLSDTGTSTYSAVGLQTKATINGSSNDYSIYLFPYDYSQSRSLVKSARSVFTLQSGGGVTDTLNQLNFNDSNSDWYMVTRDNYGESLHLLPKNSTAHFYVRYETPSGSYQPLTIKWDLSSSGSSATFAGYLTCRGGKSRLMETDNYGERLLYCYETASALFGDIGQGVTDENGVCVIDLNDIFNETVDTNVEYNVFLQKEGQGDVWVDEKMYNYFVVKGTPNLKFSWEIKARQKDLTLDYMEDIKDREERLDNGTVDVYSALDVVDREYEEYIIEQEGALIA